MPGNLNNKFRVLLAQKAEYERRHISLKAVQRETGIAWTTLQSWANNKVTRYDASIIRALCDYLNCTVGDLIVYERE